MIWQLRTQRIELGDKPVLMGIVNVTPDSFSDGGQFYRSGKLEIHAAVDFALQLIDEGARVIDIGAESTRPGAKRITADEELRRLIPVVAAIREKTETPISVDTSRAVVAKEAVGAGAEIVNDISGATFDPKMLAVLQETGAGVCLMHIQGMPETMQRSPYYNDVVSEVTHWLAGRKQAATDAGIFPERIVLDPGIGFGKNVEHNIAILQNVGRLHQLGSPLLFGVSRKRFLDALSGCDDTLYSRRLETPEADYGSPATQCCCAKPKAAAHTGCGIPQNRLSGTIAVTLFLASQGVRIFRVHDVGEIHHALTAWQLMMKK
ncbi:MAG: dihydropteroate synthase [Planctomycetaceae bacterium]|nr:dihydropteroate synthase [Planctomycetaceae bacterium]